MVDVRPATHFADYHLPGSENVEIARLLSDPAYRSGPLPLVVVDRDGSLAMMAAAVLAQNTNRRVIALYGGLQTYWAESDLGALARPGFLPQPLTPRSPAFSGRAPEASTPMPSKPTAQPKKRRSAGC